MNKGSFVLQVQMTNAAYEEHPELELASNLGQVSAKVMAGETAGAVLDSNGNSVGAFLYVPESAEES